MEEEAAAAALSAFVVVLVVGACLHLLRLERLLPRTHCYFSVFGLQGCTYCAETLAEGRSVGVRKAGRWHGLESSAYGQVVRRAPTHDATPNRVLNPRLGLEDNLTVFAYSVASKGGSIVRRLLVREVAGESATAAAASASRSCRRRHTRAHVQRRGCGPAATAQSSKQALSSVPPFIPPLSAVGEGGKLAAAVYGVVVRRCSSASSRSSRRRCTPWSSGTVAAASQRARQDFIGSVRTTPASFVVEAVLLNSYPRFAVHGVFSSETSEPPNAAHLRTPLQTAPPKVGP